MTRQDLPSRDNRFDLVPETDEPSFWHVFGIVVGTFAAVGIIAYAFSMFIAGGV